MDAAATTWAISVMPDQIGVARDLLAHSDLLTTTKHYKSGERDRSQSSTSSVIGTRRKQNRRTS
jgi:hypothetical protein